MAGSDDVGRGCLLAAEERCVLGDRELVEELCGHQTPDPKGRAGFRVAKCPGGWRNGREVDGVVMLAVPESGRLRHVMLAATHAECALDQIPCADPVFTQQAH